MSKSNFSFLTEEFPILANLGSQAEQYIHSDPGAALGKVRLLVEKMTELIFKVHQLEFPYDDSIFRRIQVLADEGVLDDKIISLLHQLRKSGNVATHSTEDLSKVAMSHLLSLFKLCKWFAESYAESYLDLSSVKFSPPEQIDWEKDYQKLEQDYKQLEAKLNDLLKERQIGQLSQEEAQGFKQRSAKASRKLDMSEAETRELIDEQLRLAGWEVDTSTLNYKLNGTTPVKGRNLAIAEWKVGSKWADYALFVGTDLYGIVEAKKYSQDISTNLHQSKIYAELAEETNQARLLGKWGKYNVPFLFSTNGRPYLKQIETKSGIWFIDIRNPRNHSRCLKGWYTPAGLVNLFEQDIEAADKKLKDNAPDYLQSKSGLGLRDYQIKAITKVEDTLIKQPEINRILLAMATGTGKTRTIIGLAYRLIQSNRFKRILFLVDRRLLASQAFDAFKDNKIEDLNTFGEIYEMKGLKDLLPELDTRLHFATVQSMVKRLFYNEDPATILPVDTYDCIIIDEAHRGYLMDRELAEEELNFKDQNDYVSKYRKVLDYFDAVGIGLTATPALHTTEIFGNPVFTYSYREAVIDGYLIDHEPPFIIKTKLSEEGIVWEKGEKPKVYDKEQNKVVELSELEDELAINVEGFNKQVLTENFNRAVLSQLVQEIDPESEEKTLIFAATDDHAADIVKYLKEEYFKIGLDVQDNAIQKITGKVYDPEQLVKRYKNEKYPSIAVTVDLLTTGIDVPAICNLVFMRRVKSRILYEQMLGRATRRCDEIDKEVFRIFDAVRLYEALEDYTQMKPVVPTASVTFTQLIDELDSIDSNDRALMQVEQLLAKYQRKRKQITDKDLDQFSYLTGGQDPEQFAQRLQGIREHHQFDELKGLRGVWKYLDELKPSPKFQLVSEHDDEERGIERGYGQGQKPEDYLLSFENFIKENINKIEALKIICSRPQELDRKSLKELLLELDSKGFNAKYLNQAWKQAKNEDIAADIISYIRTLALGNTLIGHEERIKNAISKIRSMSDWHKNQIKWIDRFEKQLLQENILQKDDLDLAPFNRDGGYLRLNKIFNNKLDLILNTINESLYEVTA
ncbi:type I restriction-modification system endonuclease [Mangrovibacterium diazotrophicum]|uniref:Type I restriction enzyme R subunit n=1 Tax=Mangrovibacterium diazotrophicum TaxID=1261403 RepID=A0A419W4P0_9BACT|nr:type I restriction-modification system endonuclease [Mangrovibacterium diazotrophicum]RKD90424.1 type I restriction enzyme R subunit [Mangrovibacterium diazotrophicum]